MRERFFHQPICARFNGSRLSASVHCRLRGGRVSLQPAASTFSHAYCECYAVVKNECDRLLPSAPLCDRPLGKRQLPAFAVLLEVFAQFESAATRHYSFRFLRARSDNVGSAAVRSRGLFAVPPIIESIRGRWRSVMARWRHRRQMPSVLVP
jgi:hypothetical protein